MKHIIDIGAIYAEAHYNLGRWYKKIGDKESAHQQYEKLKNLDKNMANELLNLINQ